MSLPDFPYSRKRPKALIYTRWFLSLSLYLPEVRFAESRIKLPTKFLVLVEHFFEKYWTEHLRKI